MPPTKTKRTRRELGTCALRWIAKWIVLAGMAGVMSSTVVAQDPSPIKEVLLVHFAHTDFGYTDQPEVVRELHRHYIDIALDAAWATRQRPAGDRFCWTIAVSYTHLIKVRCLRARKMWPTKNDMNMRGRVLVSERIVRVKTHQVNRSKSLAINFLVKSEKPNRSPQAEFEI